MKATRIRYQQTGEFHFLTFSCYRRRPYLSTIAAMELFEDALERVRRRYHFAVAGYVVMPEHVHLLVNEPQRALLSKTIQSQPMTSGINIYGYIVGHDGVGNVTSFQDGTYSSSGLLSNGLPAGPGIMGTWNFASGSGSGYDRLNRLSAASVTWPDGTSQSFCWDYDSFGNRQHQQQASGTSGFTNAPGSGCQIAGGAALLSNEVTLVGSNNQISDGLHQYDAAGDLVQDATTGNSYLYDAEGRVCAVESTAEPGFTTMTGYLYDADGYRVAKGTITSMSCDPTMNGFQFAEDYVLGPGGEELSMLNGSGTWQRTNVYAGGKLIGTYDMVGNPDYNPTQQVSASNPEQIPWLHFHLEDALGTRRMQVSGMLANLGQPEMDFQSLPFGDGLSPYPDANSDQGTELGGFLGSTPLFFTGKERDTESGNDYFEARYYSSSMGRFLSPDPGPYLVPDPQSWNRYAYVQNNPLRNTDPTGLILQIGGESGQALIDMLSKKSGLHLVPDKKGHLETKGKRDKNGTNGELAKQIERAISSDKVVNITANQGETPTYNFFDDHETHTVDMSDFSKTDSQAPDLATTLLDHVMSEYTDMAEGKDFFDAHQEALKSESKAMSGATGHKEMTRQTIDENPLFKFVYSTVQYNVLVTGGKNGTTDIDTVTKVPVEGDKKP
jgi:RHS repeat-associated protein